MIEKTCRTAAAVVVLAIAAGAVVGCESGPGAPIPAWSPPAWVRGTWTYAEGGEAFTLKATVHNVQVETRSGGAEWSIDLAETADSGTAAIEHDAGISDYDRNYPGQAGRRFYWLNIDGAGIAFTFFDVNGTAIDAYMGTAGGVGGPWRLERSGAG